MGSYRKQMCLFVFLLKPLISYLFLECLESIAYFELIPGLPLCNLFALDITLFFPVLFNVPEFMNESVLILIERTCKD